MSMRHRQFAVLALFFCTNAYSCFTSLNVVQLPQSSRKSSFLMHKSRSLSQEEGWVITGLERFKNDEQGIKALLEKKVNPNVGNERGETPLHWAVLYGKAELVRELLDAGADVNNSDYDTFTALFMASEMGSLAIVKMLITANANVNEKARHHLGSPLYIAAKKGHTEVADALIEAGAVVNIKESKTEIPLHAAIESGSLAIVKALIKAGAGLDVRGNLGFTPLCKAVQAGQVEIVNVSYSSRR